MRRYTVFLALIFMVSTVSAVQVNSFETYDSSGEKKDIFSDSDEVTFRLNVTDNQDYNITLEDPSGARPAEDQDMERISSDSYLIYEYKFSLSSSEGGDWNAFVNYTTTEEETLTEESFHVASDRPGFEDLEKQDFVPVGEDTRVSVKVTDAEDNVQSVEVQGESKNYEMSKVDETGLYEVYEARVDIDERKENSFTIRAEDSNGNVGERDFEIYGYENDEKSASVSVNVSNSCLVVLENFYAPKNGTLFVGEADYFTQEYTNRGSLEANLTVHGLNVTYEGDNKWDEGEPKGPVIQSFDSQNYTNFTEQTQVVYQKLFTNSTTSGWYTGRTSYNASCAYEGEEYNISNDDYNVFNVVNASGGVSRSGNQTTNQTIPSNVSEFEDEQTNLTYPSNVSDLENEDTNTTLEREANRTGEEGSQVEGDNDQPGVTPQPEPEPEPTPMLSLDMESVESQYVTPRGGTVRANISLTNEGNEQLSELTISPQIQKFREDWTGNDASVASLDTNETVYREMLIQTPASVESGLYVVPIIGSNPQRELDVDYFTVKITEEVENRTSMEVVEAPRSLNVRQNTSTSLPVLINNTGDTPLTNVTGRFQNMGSCGDADVDNVDEIPVNGSASLGIEFNAADTTQSCNTTLIVSSEEGSFAFSKVNFTVRPEQGLLPEKYRVPFIAFAWTGLLAAFATMRKRYSPNSFMFKAPFVMIVAGEVLIFLYLTADYYQLAQLSFLPF